MKAQPRKYATRRDIQIKHIVYKKGTKKTAKNWANLLSFTLEYFLESYEKNFTKVSNVKPKEKLLQTTKVTVPVKVMQRCLDYIIGFVELESLKLEKNRLLSLNKFEEATEIRRQEVELMQSYPKPKELKALRNQLK